MKKMFKNGLVLVTLLVANVAWSGTLSDRSLNKLMAISGINKQVVQIPDLVVSGVTQARQQSNTMSDAMFADLQKSVKNSFNANDILQVIAAEIKSKVSESDAKLLFNWYGSHLGKKITKAEEDASTAAAYQQMMKEAQTLLANKARVKFAQELDDLLNATDMAMKIQENTGIAVFTALSKMMHPEQPVNVKLFMEKMSPQMAQMRAQVQQMVIVSMVYSYKTISTDELNKYLQFLKQPVTRKFNESGIKGMVEAFNQSTQKMAKSIAVSYKKQDKYK